MKAGAGGRGRDGGLSEGDKGPLRSPEWRYALIGVRSDSEVYEAVEVEDREPSEGVVLWFCEGVRA